MKSFRSFRPSGDHGLAVEGRPEAFLRFCRRAVPGIAFALALTGPIGCVDDKDDTDGLPTEPADTTPVPTRYGALGNSLTAGFINGGLVQGGQVASYPVLVANQAGWNINNEIGATTLPLILDPGIGSTVVDGIPQSAIFVNEQGGLSTTPVNPLELLHPNLSRLPRPYDNLGIPGATTLDLLQATDATTSQSPGNLYFDLILRNANLPPGNWTALDAMTARNPNALSMWIGSNDILGGALGGNPVVGQNITPPQAWEQIFLGVVARIDAMNASYVALAGVANVADIPYVTTIPANLGTEKMPLRFNTEEADVEFVLLPFGLAALSQEDPAGWFFSHVQGFGTSIVPSHWTLTASEVADIENTARAYNVIIERECQARGWAYVDALSELAALEKDPRILTDADPQDGTPDQFTEVNGYFPWFPQISAQGFNLIRNARSAFSLDGVHPSEVGQALTANAFIRAFNDAYGLGIQEIPLAVINNNVGFENAPGFARVSGSANAEDRPAGPFVDTGVTEVMEALPSLMGTVR